MSRAADLSTEGPGRPRRDLPVRGARPSWPWLLLVVGGAIAAAWPIATLVLGDPFRAPPPRLALVPADQDPSGPVLTVPAFEHLDQRGRPFGARALEGQVWVASFFFTRCGSLCPKITRALVHLQAEAEAAGSDLRIVSFTVDPEHDRPPVLAEHADAAGADRDRWTFVTGEPDALFATIVDGFKQPMGAAGVEASGSAAEAALDIAHGVRLVLVDRALGVRGLYDADEAGVARLLEDAEAL